MTDHDPAVPDQPGIDCAIAAAAKALAEQQAVPYHHLPGAGQDIWRERAEVTVRAWQEHQRQVAEETVPDQSEGERADCPSCAQMKAWYAPDGNHWRIYNEQLIAERDEALAEVARLRDNGPARQGLNARGNGPGDTAQPTVRASSPHDGVGNTTTEPRLAPAPVPDTAAAGPGDLYGLGGNERCSTCPPKSKLSCSLRGCEWGRTVPAPEPLWACRMDASGQHRWGTGRDRNECADCDEPRPAGDVPAPAKPEADDNYCPHCVRSFTDRADFEQHWQDEHMVAQAIAAPSEATPAPTPERIERALEDALFYTFKGRKYFRWHDNRLDKDQDQYLRRMVPEVARAVWAALTEEPT